MCIYDGYNWAIITRKHVSNFLPSKTSDYRILGSGGYILGGGVWWGILWIVVGVGGFILVEMNGGGGYLLGGSGWW